MRTAREERVDDRRREAGELDECLAAASLRTGLVRFGVVHGVDVALEWVGLGDRKMYEQRGDPVTELVPGRPNVHRDHRAKTRRGWLVMPREEELAQPRCRSGEHDVVHGPAETVLDQLDVGEWDADDVEAAVQRVMQTDTGFFRSTLPSRVMPTAMEEARVSTLSINGIE